jgi:hypothetical protein
MDMFITVGSSVSEKLHDAALRQNNPDGLMF